MANEQEPKIELKKPNSEGEDQTAKIPKPLKPSIGGDNKVVLNSGTDSAIRPSDATRMAPAVVPPAQKEETVSMDNGAAPKPLTIPKPPVTGADDSTQKTTKPPSPSSDGKAKTIKLKPLKPTSDDDENQEETLSMDRDELINKEMPSSLAAAAPQPASDAPAPSVDDEATIKIQKPTLTKPAHPTANIPGAKETIKLRPSNTTPPPIPAPSANDDENQETVSMSKKTIRLVPKKPGEATDDSTQKTAKPSAPTVKLTDSQGPAAAAPTAPPPGGPAVAAGAAKPSAPTVKLPEPQAPGAGATADAGGSKKTLKLKSSAKTVVTPPPGDTGSTSGTPAPPPSKTTESAAKPKKKKDPEKGSQPGVVMTIAAFFTLLLIGYYAWMTVGQFFEGPMDETKNASVPGLSGKIKAP